MNEYALPMRHSLNPRSHIENQQFARKKFKDLLDRISNDAEYCTILQDKRTKKLLLAIADHSPFLWRTIIFKPYFLKKILQTEPHQFLQDLLQELEDVCAKLDDEASVMRHLRLARQQSALAIALADLGGLWSLEDVTRALTASADRYVSVALSFILRQAAAQGRLNMKDPKNPQTQCCLVVLALGKHGAGELNYSSDVDLVVLYDPDAHNLKEGLEPAQFYVKLTKTLSRILSESTGDGYVLRVDLRLRPDPGSTSVAVSLPAAFHYYETLGQNWERAAMIKARPIAGDLSLGVAFLQALTPFIWRKYFDYAAIADIHAMKRQIHAVRGFAEIFIPGHDIKLGRGGIREVEFFVQTQQLIFGGRRPDLRGRRTLDMLAELAREQWVSEEAHIDLTAAYIYLRTIEHRLQMIADEQTQRLPAESREMTRFAKFCGYSDLPDFLAAIHAHFLAVEKHYARLFEHAPALDAQKGSLVFTGVLDDPETLETLARIGFTDPPRVAETIRGWHFGRRAAVQSARAREVLTELVPDLLEALAGSGDPDAALSAFDGALSQMPAAVELFSILKSNKALRELFGDVLGSAPRLAAIITKTPHVLDAVIDPAFFGAKLDAVFFQTHAQHMDLKNNTEEFLDTAREMAQEDLFAIGIRLLSRAIDPAEAGPAFSALADCLIAKSLAHVERAFIRDHGVIPDGRFAVLAMGKLGSQEMTATSDLDLVMVYDFKQATSQSTGEKSLHAAQYYTRLTQRLISALTVATKRGQLYEVDMRLRPSGKKGPLAVQLSSFIQYQAEEAEIWEHLALCRARPLCGDASLMLEVGAVIKETLAQPRESRSLARAVSEMRALIAAEKGDDDINNVKFLRGGLLDIEFLAHFFILRYAGQYPGIIHPGTENILRFVAENNLETQLDCKQLIDAHRFYTDIIQIQRVILPIDVKPQDAPKAVRARIANGVGLPDEVQLNLTLSETAQTITNICERIFRSFSDKK